jgi:hypothetical protein
MRCVSTGLLVLRCGRPLVLCLALSRSRTSRVVMRMNRGALLDPPLARSRLSSDEIEERFVRKYGSQLPTYFTVPRYVATYGPAVAELCASIDFEPDAEQLMFLDIVFAVEDVETQMPAVTLLDLIAPRQNVKSSTFEMCSLGWLYLDQVRVRRVVWSAHEEDTARGAMKEMRDHIEDSWLMDLQPKDRSQGFVSGNNATRIVTAKRDGFVSWVDFRTRTKGGGRGGRADKLIVDEAFAAMPAHMAALSYVLSTAKKPQRLRGSSAARPESDLLRQWVADGREGRVPKAAFAEYCAPDPASACDAGDRCRHTFMAVGCAMGKPEMIAMANTQYGKRIQPSEVLSQWQESGAEAGRERLGWHDQAGAVDLKPLRVDQWLAVRDPLSQRGPGVHAVGVDESQDGTLVAFAEAGRRVDGRLHVKPSAPPEGMRTVDAIVGYAEKQRPIVTVINGASPTAAHVPELLTRGFVRVARVDDEVPKGAHRLLVLTAQDNARACGGLVSDVRSGVLVQTDEPALNLAVERTPWRDLAGGVALEQKRTSVDSTSLQAVINARHGLVVFGAAKVKKRTWAAIG